MLGDCSWSLQGNTWIQSTIQARFLVVGGVILGYSFGLTGVLVASCLSNFYRCVDLLFFIPKNVTHLPISFLHYGEWWRRWWSHSNMRRFMALSSVPSEHFDDLGGLCFLQSCVGGSVGDAVPCSL